MPLKLKGLVLRSGVLQAPMASCTDLAFRLIAREKGLEFGFLEMVSANALVRKGRRTLEMMKTAPEDRPLGAQLMGGDPEMMARAAEKVESMGFALLDLNLGCPAPKITGGGQNAGSALLRQPDRAERIFQAVVRAVSLPVTVKMRAGYTDPSGGEAVEIAKRAEQAGICAVTVHGRTRQQKYGGKADYGVIGEVKRAVSIPVIGNGDVYSGEDAKRLVSVSGCDAVMIGRGGLGNPWLYKEVEAALRGEAAPERPDFAERKETLVRHMELELDLRGERLGVLHMRRIACWYLHGFPGSVTFRRAVNAAKTGEEMRAAITSCRPEPPGAQDRR